MSLIQDLHERGVYAIPVEPEWRQSRAHGRIICANRSVRCLSPEKSAMAVRVQKKEVLAFQNGKHDGQIDALSQALQRARAASVRQDRAGLNDRKRQRDKS